MSNVTQTSSPPETFSLKEVLPIWLFSRLLVFALLILASSVDFASIPAREGTNFNPTMSLSSQRILADMQRILSSADASWYFDIAEVGYHPGPSTNDVAKNWVFFPLLPIVLRALNMFTGSSLLSGLLLSHVSFFLGLVVFARLMACWNFDQSERRHALWAICLFPTSYFFSAPLTESVFFLLLVSCWFFVEKKQPILAAVMFLLLSATRPTGLILYPAFLMLLFEQRDFSASRKLTAGLIAPLGAALYLVYLQQLTGNFLAFSDNQSAWGRNQQSFWSLLGALFTHPWDWMRPWNFTALNTCITLILLVSSAQLIRLKHYSLAMILLLPTTAALSTGSVQSMARFAMTLFPLFIVLPTWMRSKNAETFILVTFACIFTAMTILYARHVTAAMA